MKTRKILIVCGSITKKESLIYFKGNKLDNTTIAEADQPYSNYYGQIPDKPRPNSLFLFTELEYSLEEVLRLTQNIDICAKNQVNVASAVLYINKHRLPAIRIRNFPDYEHIKMLQQCYTEQGVMFSKRSLPDKEAIIKVNKCFWLEDAGDGYFLDLDEENEGYITFPYYPEMSEFEILIQNIRNNSSCSLFDAALGGLIIDGKVKDIIRIYTGHLNLDILKCIMKEALKWTEVKNKVKSWQVIH